MVPLRYKGSYEIIDFNIETGYKDLMNIIKIHHNKKILNEDCKSQYRDIEWYHIFRPCEHY